ncbi:substrate-binding periplasmic protein [Alkalibacter saccharofermentans]|uniref:Polar amino acid transport system substrate-binding protein n=1 Tax=Alkalibacter saccharofermentans DSM 14828 TaxID=1120975 RepID=A0A1M4T892_9FIRM|nr:ABC transporter substrate-binding protein [Alkalibacter saccharofermentans]SHE40772.1 polar amino acid transport system substrate-binding protein [Alkalibacter saccharofermentans DSM 14828]
MKKISLIMAVLLLSAILMFAGCSSDSAGGDVLRIGVDDSYPPMEYRDENNELVGFDIALARAIGEKLDMEVEFVSTAWDGIFQGLETQNYDVIISSVSITPSRLETFLFSEPYLANGQVIVVKPGDVSVQSPEDLDGKTVGVQLGTTADNAVQKYMEELDIELIKYDEIIQTFSAMKAGYVDYIVVDYPVAIEYVGNDPASFEISTAQLTNEPIGVCIRKDDVELKEKIDQALSELREEGTLAQISIEWLKEDYTSNIDTELNVIE